MGRAKFGNQHFCAVDVHGGHDVSQAMRAEAQGRFQHLRTGGKCELLGGLRRVELP